MSGGVIIPFYDFSSSIYEAKFNILLAKKFGVVEAVYVEELANMQTLSIHKNEYTLFNNAPYFYVDRAKINNKLSIDIKTQRYIDKKLVANGVIFMLPNSEDFIYLDRTNIANLMSTSIYPLETSDLINDDVKLKEVEKKTKSTRESKSKRIIESLKKSIQTDNVDLKKLYDRWIDVCCDKFGYMSTEAVVKVEFDFHNFANNDINVEAALIKYMIEKTYKSSEWAIKAYKEKAIQIDNIQNTSNNLSKYEEDMKLLDEQEERLKKKLGGA